MVAILQPSIWNVFFYFLENILFNTNFIQFCSGVQLVTEN